MKLEREQESLTVHVEPGMINGQVGRSMDGRVGCSWAYTEEEEEEENGSDF